VGLAICPNGWLDREGADRGRGRHVELCGLRRRIATNSLDNILEVDRVSALRASPRLRPTMFLPRDRARQESERGEGRTGGTKKRERRKNTIKTQEINTTTPHPPPQRRRLDLAPRFLSPERGRRDYCLVFFLFFVRRSAHGHGYGPWTTAGAQVSRSVIPSNQSGVARRARAHGRRTLRVIRDGGVERTTAPPRRSR